MCSVVLVSRFLAAVLLGSRGILSSAVLCLNFSRLCCSRCSWRVFSLSGVLWMCVLAGVHAALGGVPGVPGGAGALPDAPRGVHGGVLGVPGGVPAGVTGEAYSVHGKAWWCAWLCTWRCAWCASW